MIGKSNVDSQSKTTSTSSIQAFRTSDLPELLDKSSTITDISEILDTFIGERLVTLEHMKICHSYTQTTSVPDDKLVENMIKECKSNLPWRLRQMGRKIEWAMIVQIEIVQPIEEIINEAAPVLANIIELLRKVKHIASVPMEFAVSLAPCTYNTWSGSTMTRRSFIGIWIGKPEVEKVETKTEATT